MRKPTMRYLMPSLAVTAMTVLAGCAADTGSAQVAEPAQDVASIATPAPTSGSTAAPSANARRPQATLDTTDDQHWGWRKAFWQCLRDNGVPFGDKPGQGIAPTNESLDRNKYPVQYEKCAQLEPLTAPELSPETNPKYMDSYRQMINCLNSRGLKVKPLPDGGGWNYDGPPTLSNEEQQKVRFDCQKEAFSGDL